MRDRIKHLRDVHHYGDCFTRVLTLVETRDLPSRNGEQGQGGGVPRFEAVLGGGEYPVPPQWTGGGAPPISSLPGREVRWGGRSGPGLLAFPAINIGIMMGFFQIAGMSTKGTERLKSSIRKVRPCSPRWGNGLPYGRCNASLVERPVGVVHTMVVVEVPHEPSECPIVLGRTGTEPPTEGLCNRSRAGVGFSLEGD